MAEQHCRSQRHRGHRLEMFGIASPTSPHLLEGKHTTLASLICGATTKGVSHVKLPSLGVSQGTQSWHSLGFAQASKGPGESEGCTTNRHRDSLSLNRTMGALC